MNNHEPSYGSPFPHKVKAKKLYNKAQALKVKMFNLIAGDLQFEAQDPQTKQDYYYAINHIQAFIDNIN